MNARTKEPAGFEKIDIDPLGADVLKVLFPMHKGSKRYLAITETDQIECKESFGGNTGLPIASRPLPLLPIIKADILRSA